MIGFIYIMSNPIHEGLLKIGQTGQDPDIRRNDLNSTGVPEDFVLEYRVLSSDYLRLEKEIHRKLKDLRHRQDREFFKITVPEAINTIREIAGDRIENEKIFYTSPEDIKKLEKERKKERRQEEEENRRKEKAQRLKEDRQKEKIELAAKKQNQRLAAERKREARKELFWKLRNIIGRILKGIISLCILIFILTVFLG